MYVKVTVHSRLPEDAKQGDFQVFVSLNISFDGLIKKICMENGIPMKSSYVLKTEASQVLRWSGTLRDSVTGSETHLFLYDSAVEATKPKICACLWWFIGSISLLLGVAGLATVVVMLEKNNQIQYDYGIVMDAGSTHTNLFVYEWDSKKKNNTALAKQTYVCEVEGPGLSSYKNDPEGLAPGLKLCLQEAEDNIPSGKISDTPIYLAATAGMRLVEEVNKSTSDAIFKVVRDTIKEFSFKFTDPEKQARIITGAEEGMYSWVTTNYITGRFGVKPPTLLKSGKTWQLSAVGDKTAGALDLGGASTQIAYFPGKNTSLPDKYRGDLVLYGLNFSVYTHSYLCYGVVQITNQYRALLVKSQNYSRTIANPCGPMGNTTYHTHSEIFEAPCTKDSRFSAEIEADQNTKYTFVGGSNPKACHSQVQELFNFNAPCPWGADKCSFNGTFQPDVYGKYYALSNFYYQMDFMNLTKSENVELAAYAHDLKTLCSKSWDEIKDMKVHRAYLLPEYCFRGHYILTLLNEAYEFEDWSKINFVKKINGTDVGWSLGFMIANSDDLSVVAHKDFISQVAFILLLILCGVLVILAFGFAFHAMRNQRLPAAFSKLWNYIVKRCRGKKTNGQMICP